MKGPNTERILKRAQLALMNDRISRINKQIAYFKDIRSSAEEYLFTALPGDVFAEVGHWMEVGRRKSFDNIRRRQKRKFQQLLDSN